MFHISYRFFGFANTFMNDYVVSLQHKHAFHILQFSFNINQQQSIETHNELSEVAAPNFGKYKNKVLADSVLAEGVLLPLSGSSKGIRRKVPVFLLLGIIISSSDLQLHVIFSLKDPKVHHQTLLHWRLGFHHEF